MGHLMEHLDFRAADRLHRRANLPVEVDQVECVGVCDMEGADTQPYQRQQMDPTDTTLSRYGNALAATCVAGSCRCFMK
jgi:hypothetical protein